jgi:hypothetical protein
MLLGLSEGQSIDWAGADGRAHRLRVASVGAPRARQRMPADAHAVR